MKDRSVTVRLGLRAGAALLLALLAAPAVAGDITVTVTDAGGNPVPNAVVTIDAPGRSRAPAASRSANML
jgi:hypothetical protein